MGDSCDGALVFKNVHKVHFIVLQIDLGESRVASEGRRIFTSSQLTANYELVFGRRYFTCEWDDLIKQF